MATRAAGGWLGGRRAAGRLGRQAAGAAVARGDDGVVACGEFDLRVDARGVIGRHVDHHLGIGRADPRLEAAEEGGQATIEQIARALALPLVGELSGPRRGTGR